MSLGSQFGLLPTGFVAKMIGDVTSDLNAAFQQAFGASINVTPQSRFGQVIGIMAERYAELWALALTVYASFNPNDATGVSLSSIAALTGTVPVTPTPSTVTETAVGTPGTVLNSGRVVNTASTSQAFQSTASATIVAVPAWAAVAYALTNRVNTGGKVWQCTHAGTATTPPTGAKGSTFTDGALTWLCLGTGTGAIDFPMSSSLTGPIVAAAGDLTSIQTPVGGWNDAYNVSPAVPGIGTEADANFRIRRVAELHGPGKSAVGAIQAAMLQVSGVTTCTVFENVTDAVNSDGMPPHSVEVMVQGTATPLAIATAVFQNVAAGIATTGNQAPVAVTDSQGITHSVLYSNPVVIPIWITFNAIVDPNNFPSNGALQAINNVLDYGNALVPDYDVIGTQLAGAVLNGVPAQGVSGVPGVLDPGLPLIGTVNPPVSTATISITSRQIAQFNAGRIVFNTTNGSP